MLDPMVQPGGATLGIPASAAPLAKPQVFDPTETHTFALMMRDPSSQAAGQSGHASEPSALQRALIAQGTDFSESLAALDRSRQSMTASDLSDPMMSMWRAVDFSFQSTTLFTRLHIATGLSTAVSNSFNSLLKGQQ